MIRKKFTSILFLAVANLTLAQPMEIYKLRDEIDRVQNDTIKLVNVSNISRFYAETIPDSSYIFAERQLAIARKLNFKIEEAVALREVGYAQMNMGNYPRSLQTMLAAIAMAQDPKIERKALIGNYTSYDNFFDRSKDGHNQRLQILGHLHQQMGILYATLNNYEKAIFHHYEGLKLAKACGNVTLQIIFNLTLGRTYLSVGKPDSALVIEQKAYDLAMQEGFIKYLGSILLNLGRIHAARGNKQLAIEYFHRAIKMSSEQGYYRGVVVGNLELYKNSANKDSSLHYIQLALSVAKYIQAPDLLLRSYKAFADYYTTINNNDSTTKYQALVIRINDSLFNTKQTQQFQNIDFDERQKKQQIEAANAAFRVKLRIYGLLAGLVIFLCVAIILWRHSHQRKLANALLSQQKKELESTLETLRATQNQLIQSEKMASLGELTAGIAHEIQNPLNFVNNFSEVNTELIEDLKGERRKAIDERDEALEDQLLNDIAQNLEKINHHGKRADSIVKGMLQHSRVSSGHREPTDLSALVNEYMTLSYHAMRARDKSFTASMKTDFDCDLNKILIIPQDIGQVLINLYNNAFQSMNEKTQMNIPGYEPVISVSTKKLNGKAIITVRDNGIGITAKNKDKIFQPFFTTKPAGTGTGLGLSLSYDIITKEHGGEIKVESKEGEGAEFIITLPA